MFIVCERATLMKRIGQLIFGLFFLSTTWPMPATATNDSYLYNPSTKKASGLDNIVWDNERYYGNSTVDQAFYVGEIISSTDIPFAESLLQGCLAQTNLSGDWPLILVSPCLLTLDIAATSKSQQPPQWLLDAHSMAAKEEDLHGTSLATCKMLSQVSIQALQSEYKLKEEQPIHGVVTQKTESNKNKHLNVELNYLIIHSTAKHIYLVKLLLTPGANQSPWLFCKVSDWGWWNQ